MGKKQKAEKDLEIRRQELQVEMAKYHEWQTTIRHAIWAGWSLGALGLVCWVVVKVTSQPPWLILCLAIVGPTGFIAVCVSLVARTIATRLRQLEEEVTAEHRDYELEDQ